MASSPNCQATLTALILPLSAHADGLAAHLLKRFGSLRYVLTASKNELALTLPDHPTIVDLLLAVRSAAIWALRERAWERPQIRNARALLHYLYLRHGHASDECVRIFYLNADQHLLSEEILCEGSPSQSPFPLRTIVGRALNLGATGILVVHNHPSGKAEASIADRDITAQLRNIARSLEITLVDHLIVAGNRSFSFRDAGLL